MLVIFVRRSGDLELCSLSDRAGCGLVWLGLAAVGNGMARLGQARMGSVRFGWKWHGEDRSGRARREHGEARLG